MQINLNTVCPFLNEEEKKINARASAKKHYEENKDKKQNITKKIEIKILKLGKNII